MKTIFDISKQITEAYEHGVETPSGISFNIVDTNKSIRYITSSKYESLANSDASEYTPYYNITNYRLHVAIRATDFDTKDIKTISETPDYVRSMLMGKRTTQWQKEVNFSTTLNRMGEISPKMGWLMTKKVYTDDGTVNIKPLIAENVQFDVANPLGGLIKELHTDVKRSYLVAKKDSWDEESVDRLLQNDDDTFDIEEITGIMSSSIFDDSLDQDDYGLYKFIIHSDSDNEETHILYKEKLTGVITDYYEYMDWFKMDGRTGRGIPEDMFEAQWGTNETKLLEREAFMLASKTLFVTDSDTLENNVNTDMDNGHIITIGRSDRFNQVNTMTNALPAFNSLISDWDKQGERATFTFEALTGETLPSGTPFRSVAIQNKEASSTFILRRQEFGSFLERMINQWVLPEILKDIDQDWILSAEFSPEELGVIDDAFGTYEANDVIKRKIQDLDVDIDFSAETYGEMIESYKNIVQQNDNTRFLHIPDGYFSDFKVKTRVITTNESQNKAVVLESLSKIISDVSNTFNPQTGTFAMLENPALSALFSEAVELSGSTVSPVTLQSIVKGPTSKLKVNNEPINDEPELEVQTALEKEGAN